MSNITNNDEPRKAEYDYVVTPCGDVISTSSNWRGYGQRTLSKHLNEHGYVSVRIIVNGKRVRKAVHALVAKRYMPNHDRSLQVRHLDGNKQNPFLGNLEWGTAKENADDRERHGKTSRGVSHSEAIKAGKARAAIAKALGQ